MNIFKEVYSFTWWQVGMFKICLLAVGIIVGANLPNIFAPYTILLIAIALIIGVYLATICFRKSL